MTTSQPTLTDRAQRCVKRALSGEATMLVVQSDELPEAKRLCEGADVVCCTGEEARTFLEWLRKPKRRK
jgi:hypothetical protein